MKNIVIKMKTKGKFIVIDGIDGSGKTTICKMMNINKNFICTNEPSGFFREIIKSDLLKNKVSPIVDSMLFAIDRYFHTNEIKNLIESGINVISDRYILSSYAYQIASGLTKEFIDLINVNVIIPDLTIILDIIPEISINRVKKERKTDKFEDVTFLNQVRKQYLNIDYPNKIIIDADRKIEIVLTDVEKLIVELLNK